MSKVVLITGASSGMGELTAQYLANNGYIVYAGTRDENLVSKQENINNIYIDVTKTDSIKKAIETVIKNENKIDVLVNNAGYGLLSTVEDGTDEEMFNQFDVNVFALHECTRQIIPIMREQGFGKIIQHSSLLGLVSLKARGAYNASKYAVEGLTDTLRLELKGTNIYPVLLNTGPITSNFRKTAMKKLKENIDIENSLFKETYQASLKADKTTVPFNEEAISVAKVVHEIVISKKPKPRYYITKATYLFGYIKRFVSTTLLDKVLIKV
jgi:short-subunit dehydrogenase